MMHLSIQQINDDFEANDRFRKDFKSRWIRSPGPNGSTCGATWTATFGPLEVTVIHCGHPTALRPYYVSGVKVEPVSGYGGLSPTFKKLKDAQVAAFHAAVKELKIIE